MSPFVSSGRGGHLMENRPERSVPAMAPRNTDMTSMAYRNPEMPGTPEGADPLKENPMVSRKFCPILLIPPMEPRGEARMKRRMLRRESRMLPIHISHVGPNSFR